MPLDMPESVLVRFKGQMQPGVTLRDLVHAIPLYAIKQGLLTVAKQGKKNIFSGRILEIEGLPDMKVEQAFELSDASAERSAAGCTVRLNKEPVIEYINSNIVLLKNMIAQGYADARTIGRRIKAMEAWLANPQLLAPDEDAEYAAVIEIDLAEIDTTAFTDRYGGTMKGIAPGTQAAAQGVRAAECSSGSAPPAFRVWIAMRQVQELADEKALIGVEVGHGDFEQVIGIAGHHVAGDDFRA
eukprot:gene7433-9475_t